MMIDDNTTFRCAEMTCDHEYADQCTPVLRAEVERLRAELGRIDELEARIDGLVSDNATLQAWEFDWKQRAAKAEAKLAKLEEALAGEGEE